MNETYDGVKAWSLVATVGGMRIEGLTAMRGIYIGTVNS